KKTARCASPRAVRRAAHSAPPVDPYRWQWVARRMGIRYVAVHVELHGVSSRRRPWPALAARPWPPPLGVVAWALRSLALHWDLLWQMVTTDLRGRYVGSSLGLFWTVIHPLVLILIYTVVFARVMGARLPGSPDAYGYGIYLCSALLPWLAFQEVVVRSTTIFPDHANLVRKVAFPKVILYGFITLS